MERSAQFNRTKKADNLLNFLFCVMSKIKALNGLLSGRGGI